MAKTNMLFAAGGAVVGLLMTAGMTPVSAQSPGAQNPSLAGTWVLNRNLSQMPGMRMRGDSAGGGQPGEEGARRRGGRGYPGGGEEGGEGGEGFGGGRRGFGGGEEGGEGGDAGGMRTRRADFAKMRQAMSILLPRVDAVVITRADSVLDLSWGAGRSMRVPLNGKTVEQVWGETKVKMKAQWKDGELHVERKADGVKVDEVWSRSPGSPRLIVATKVQGNSPEPLQFQRVYDIQSGSGGSGPGS